MGRIKQERRTIGAVAGKFDTDTINLDGSVGNATYVNGFGVSYTYTRAQRQKTLTSFNTPETTYVTATSYAPSGGVTSSTWGAGTTAVTITDSYNSRLQPVTLSAATPAATIMSLNYDFHLGAGDNGNVFKITNNRDGNRTQNFSYDNLNRISQAFTNGPNWGENFTIDPWGNLTNKSGVSGKTNTEPLSTSATVQNRLTGFGYDAAGNMISNGTATYTYDAENRLIATAGISYIYDGDGKRVEKCTQGTTAGTCSSTATGTLYWPGWGDEINTESDLAGNFIANYIYFNGQRIARRDASTGAVHYYFSDHLGSHSLITDVNGTMPPQEESDFYPYGGEIPVSGSDTNHYKFTGKERDAESGLDDFEARYYGSSLGRFMTPDWAAKPTSVPYAKFGNPQSLNLYSYVQNSPTSVADLDGHELIDTEALLSTITSFLSSSHSASGSVSTDAGHSIDKAGPVTVNARAFSADASASASYGLGGVKASAQTAVAVANISTTEGSTGTTAIKALNADAGAHAGISTTGVAAGAGANADVLSASQTVKIGPVTMSVTGNVGIGAQASASLSNTGVSASAGITPGFGGAVSVSINFGQGSISGGASAQSTNTGTGIKTTVNKPEIKPQSD